MPPSLAYREVRRAGAMAALAVAALLSGCGDLLSGGQKEIDLRATAGGGRTESGATISGTLSFDVSVHLLGEDGAQHSATGGPVAGQVAIESADSAGVTRGGVSPQGYQRVRAVFTRVEAEVTGGLVVNGLPLLGFMAVDIPPGDSLVVEMEVEMGVAARARETLVLDLAAAAWLPQVDPLTRRAPASAFLAAVDIRHR